MVASTGSFVTAMSRGASALIDLPGDARGLTAIAVDSAGFGRRGGAVLEIFGQRAAWPRHAMR